MRQGGLYVHANPIEVGVVPKSDAKSFNLSPKFNHLIMGMDSRALTLLRKGFGYGMASIIMQVIPSYHPLVWVPIAMKSSEAFNKTVVYDLLQDETVLQHDIKHILIDVWLQVPHDDVLLKDMYIVFCPDVEEFLSGSRYDSIRMKVPVIYGAH